MNDYETAVAFDTDGNVVFKKTGIEDEVNFSHEELSNLKGCVLTHNHPYNKVSEDFGVVNTSAFSSDDLMIAYQQGLLETRMAIGNERHSFRWNNPDKKKAELFLYDMDILENELNTSANIIAENADAAIDKAEISPTQDNIASMQAAVTKYYEALKSQADKMNDFISNNQHIGYVFRKGCL